MAGGEQRIPVKCRRFGVNVYAVYGRYDTFEQAAEVVRALRQDDSVAWAYVPDEYAPKTEPVSLVASPSGCVPAHDRAGMPSTGNPDGGTGSVSASGGSA